MWIIAIPTAIITFTVMAVALGLFVDAVVVRKIYIADTMLARFEVATMGFGLLFGVFNLFTGKLQVYSWVALLPIVITVVFVVVIIILIIHHHRRLQVSRSH